MIFSKAPDPNVLLPYYLLLYMLVSMVKAELWL